MACLLSSLLLHLCPVNKLYAWLSLHYSVLTWFLSLLLFSYKLVVIVFSVTVGDQSCSLHLMVMKVNFSNYQNKKMSTLLCRLSILTNKDLIGLATSSNKLWLQTLVYQYYRKQFCYPFRIMLHCNAEFSFPFFPLLFYYYFFVLAI